MDSPNTEQLRRVTGKDLGKMPKLGPGRPSFWEKVRYQLKVSFREPTAIVGILAALLFTYLIVVPIISMMIDGVTVQYADRNKAGDEVGAFTLYNLTRTLTSPISENLFWKPLMNTLTIGFGSIILSVGIGGTLAWLLSRTDMFGKKWFSAALIVPYMLPGWTFALAWTTLFKNRTVGGQIGWFEALGFSPPDWLAYGPFPITVILSLHYAPFVLLLFGNALKRFDSQLEDSARILGAGARTVTLRVILPLMRPSLMSASILIFAKAIGDFGITYVLGMPIGYEVLATSLYRNISSRQTGVAAVIAGAIILIGAIALWVDTRMAREAKRFVTVGSKGSMDRLTRLGKWRTPATIYAGAMFSISVAIPIVTLSLSTIMRKPGIFSWDNFTLDYWIGTDLPTIAMPEGVLITPEFWSAAWNSIWMVGLASITAGILGLLVGYVVVRSPIRQVGSYLRTVTFMPYLVPGIAFAVAYLSLFAEPRGPIPALYGTAAILVIALIADQMPYASRAGITAMMQLGKDPEEAAQVAGAGWLKRMQKVIIPIQKGSLTTGILLPFISGIKGLSLVVILAVPGTDLLTTYSLRLVDYNYSQAANIVVLMISAIAFFGTMLGQKLTKSNLSEGLSS